MIFEKVKAILVDQLGVDEDKIAMETNLVEDLGADSLDLFEVVIQIEEEFDIQMENTDELKTVADAVKLIENLTEGK